MPVERFRDVLRQMYETARDIPPGYALEAARRAQSDEERYFYAFISDMNLQRVQQAYIQAGDAWKERDDLDETVSLD